MLEKVSGIRTDDRIEFCGIGSEIRGYFSRLIACD